MSIALPVVVAAPTQIDPPDSGADNDDTGNDDVDETNDDEINDEDVTDSDDTNVDDATGAETTTGGPDLPRTGTNNTVLLRLAFLALVAGAAMMYSSRKAKQ